MNGEFELFLHAVKMASGRLCVNHDFAFYIATLLRICSIAANMHFTEPQKLLSGCIAASVSNPGAIKGEEGRES